MSWRFDLCQDFLLKEMLKESYHLNQLIMSNILINVVASAAVVIATHYFLIL